MDRQSLLAARVLVQRIKRGDYALPDDEGSRVPAQFEHGAERHQAPVYVFDEILAHRFGHRGTDGEAF